MRRLPGARVPRVPPPYHPRRAARMRVVPATSGCRCRDLEPRPVLASARTRCPQLAEAPGPPAPGSARRSTRGHGATPQCENRARHPPARATHDELPDRGRVRKASADSERCAGPGPRNRDRGGGGPGPQGKPQAWLPAAPDPGECGRAGAPEAGMQDRGPSRWRRAGQGRPELCLKSPACGGPASARIEIGSGPPSRPQAQAAACARGPCRPPTKTGDDSTASAITRLA